MEIEENRDEKIFFKRLTIKQIIMVLVVIGLGFGLGSLLNIYNKNKLSEFTQKLKDAKTSAEYKALIDDGCPGKLISEARHKLGKAFYEEGKFEESFDVFEEIIKKDESHFLYGRAIIGYIHSGFQIEKNPDFLDKARVIVEEKDFPWKEEALYDIALYYEEVLLADKAADIYTEIAKSFASHWKDNAEFKLAKLKMKKKD